MNGTGTKRLGFAGLSVSVPSDWEDITDTVEDGSPPWTLAPQGAGGALQFSLAKYKAGPVPDLSPSDLAQMVREFGRSRHWGDPADLVTEMSPLRLASGSFTHAESFVRLWYVSDGANLVFVTYVVDGGSGSAVVPQCERVVRSVSFG